MSRIEVLDHGYVELVESWGSDERIIEAARMSTNKGFNGWGPVTCPNCGGAGITTHDIIVSGTEHDTEERDCATCKTTGYVLGDEKLLRYLWTNHHTTPFEMAGMTIEVQAPIFVFREWHRHRTQSYNEMSARYTPLPDVHYIPTVERLIMSGGSNKQAQGASGDTLREDTAQTFRSRLADQYERCEYLYRQALDAGAPKELARLVLPVGRYSRMRASANLWNWLHFLTLRTAENAQWEIRQYAAVVAGMVGAQFPRTYELWCGE